MPEPAQVRGAGDVQGPEAWFRDLPVVTKYWFGASMFCTLAVNFNIISPALIPFMWQNVSSKLELWRLLTCFLYVGPVRRFVRMAFLFSSSWCVSKFTWSLQTRRDRRPQQQQCINPCIWKHTTACSMYVVSHSSFTSYYCCPYFDVLHKRFSVQFWHADFDHVASAIQ